MNDTALMLKGCMAVIALSLILQYVVCTWSKLKGGAGKTRCHWREATSRVRETMNGGVTLVLSSSMMVVPLLLVIAGDVELNPGPGGRYTCTNTAFTLSIILCKYVKYWEGEVYKRHTYSNLKLNLLMRVPLYSKILSMYTANSIEFWLTLSSNVGLHFLSS